MKLQSSLVESSAGVTLACCCSRSNSWITRFFLSLFFSLFEHPLYFSFLNWAESRELVKREVKVVSF
jgi:hypothetical protein